MDRRHRLPNTWKEGRRQRALELTQHGWKPSEMAAAVGVSAAAVSPWVAETWARGREAWLAQPTPLGPIKLSPDPLHVVPERFSPGAEAYGCRGECWTCALVAAGLWEAFGVSSHQAHVVRLLKRLDWTPQRPIERAAQRDEAVMKLWRTEVWPELKHRRASKGAP
jgi:transposase